MGVQFKALKYVIQNYLKKNQNKIFWTIGQFEFEYFGGSDVENILVVIIVSACIRIYNLSARKLKKYKFLT